MQHYLQLLMGKELSPWSPGVGSASASLSQLETGAHTVYAQCALCTTHLLWVCLFMSHKVFLRDWEYYFTTS